MQQQDIIGFLETSARLYQKLLDFHWLSSTGIVPLSTTAYSLADLRAANGKERLRTLVALSPRYKTAEVGRGTCDRSYTQVSELWDYLHAGHCGRNR